MAKSSPHISHVRNKKKREELKVRVHIQHHFTPYINPQMNVEASIMLQTSLSFLRLCPFLVLTLLQIPSCADFLSATCSSTDTYTNGSTFESNLIGLLNSFNTNATANTGFSAALFGNSSNEAYGLFMCYAIGTNYDNCFNCLKIASSEAPQRCTGSATAIIFYDNCFLRYSGKDFRSQVDYNDQLCLASSASPLDDASMKIVTNLISNLSLEAPENPEMIASRAIQTDARNISARVQCTRDLSQDGCGQCLHGAVANNEFSACSRKASVPGMRLIFGSCILQYETIDVNVVTFPMTPAHPAASSGVIAPAGPAPTSPMTPAGAPPSSVPGSAKGTKAKSTVRIVVSTIVASIIAGLAVFGFYIWRTRQANKNNEEYHQETVETELKRILNPKAEYQVFNFTLLKIATNNFSDINKLGRGGFGAVYKGVLPDGQEIAVKRLSECSVQGITEFKNEVDSTWPITPPKNLMSP